MTASIYRADSNDGRALVGPFLVVVATALALGLIGVRGADYPAHQLRAALWEQTGFGVWNMNWYGGHPTPSYSVLGPPLVAALGPLAVITLGSLIGTYCFARLAADLLPSPTALAGYAFAICTIPNAVVGRAPFALGLGLAVAAVWVWHRHHTVAGCALAALTGLVSPVAAAFLVVVASAACIDRLVARDRRDGVVAACALTASAAAPIGLLGFTFGSAGRFPFVAIQLVVSIVIAALVAVLVPVRVVRIGVVLTVLASLVLYVIPNPMGGNFVRLVQHVGVPLAVTSLALVSRRLTRPLAAVLAVAVAWTVQPGVVAAWQWAGDESVDAEYHQPLIDEVQRRNRDGEPLGRLEIPFTDNHWESLYVALEVPYARGWERQVDLDRNEVLYDDELTLAEYREWLDLNGVRWIALADVAVDEGGLAEWYLLQRESHRVGIDWLDEVWSNEHWQLFEISDHQPIVDPPARLVRQNADELVVRATEPATVTIRYHYDGGLSIDGASCVTTDVDGWIVAHLATSGLHRITVEPGDVMLGDRADACEGWRRHRQPARH